MPRAASSPSCAGPRKVPAASATLPRRDVAARGRGRRCPAPLAGSHDGASPRRGAREAVRERHVSMGTTASAPAGIMAPVMMGAAVPGCSGCGRWHRPGRGQRRRSSAPPSGTSAERMAKPSIWELAKGGRLRGAATSVGQAAAQGLHQRQRFRSGALGLQRAVPAAAATAAAVVCATDLVHA